MIWGVHCRFKPQRQIWNNNQILGWVSFQSHCTVLCTWTRWRPEILLELNQHKTIKRFGVQFALCSTKTSQELKKACQLLRNRQFISSCFLLISEAHWHWAASWCSAKYSYWVPFHQQSTVLDILIKVVKVTLTLPL